MVLKEQHKLSRRERQIMDVLYRLGRATAAEVHAAIPDPPGYSAVRAMLRVLEEKKHIRHEEKDLRYVFIPVVPREKARRSAVRHLLDTFFDGSPEQAVATLLDVSARDLSQEELDRLAALVEKAKREGR
jgi:BlaI family transcriptional regulator, penicillinase repressor